MSPELEEERRKEKILKVGRKIDRDDTTEIIASLSPHWWFGRTNKLSLLIKEDIQNIFSYMVLNI